MMNKKVFYLSSTIVSVLIVALLVYAYGGSDPTVHGHDSGEIDFGFNAMPVGSILAWHKSMSGTPSLPSGWIECNGQTISDADSPYNGEALPDLNSELYAGGRGYYLRGSSTSGSFSPSSYFTGNGNKYDFSEAGNVYYGIGYGRLLNGEDGQSSTYSGTDNNLGTNEIKVAAMNVVWIIKIK